MSTEINQNNFEIEVLQSDAVVLVDFWAAWCGPCQMQSPIIEELADEYKNSAAGKSVKIGKVNVDENQDLALKYNIMSIPTLLIFKNGEVKEQMRGVHQKARLVEKLEKYL